MTQTGYKTENRSFLAKACADAAARVRSGYYLTSSTHKHRAPSLLKSLKSSVSIIAELKPRSPTAGELRRVDDVQGLALKMIGGGADAISVLTDPDNFNGSVENLRAVSQLGVPTLMKDFVISREQLRFAAEAGASAVLLIRQAFVRNLCYITLEEAIRHAHDMGLEVVLEVYRAEDVKPALQTEADIVGVNSRNLDSLDLSLERARLLVHLIPEEERWRVVVESGIKTHEDVKTFLQLGVNKFLVGTAIMASEDVEAEVRRIKGELV